MDSLKSLFKLSILPHASFQKFLFALNRKTICKTGHSSICINGKVKNTMHKIVVTRALSYDAKVINDDILKLPVYK